MSKRLTEYVTVGDVRVLIFSILFLCLCGAASFIAGILFGDEFIKTSIHTGGYRTTIIILILLICGTVSFVASIKIMDKISGKKFMRKIALN